jgi:pyruvate dehydrogenase E2 component (dihydrolipoamide acetyltransferase)
MSQDILMPRLSDTMEEGTISRWLKHEGDRVEKGDILAEVETDKANMEVNAYGAGLLNKVLVQEGQTARIGDVIAVLGETADDDGRPSATLPTLPTPGQRAQAQADGVPAGDDTTAGEPKQAPPAPRPEEGAVTRAGGAETGSGGPQRSGEVTTGPETPTQPAGRLMVTPLARRMAADRGIDLARVSGTGPGGRIVRDDIESYRSPAGSPPAGDVGAAAAGEGARRAPLSRMQQVIARRMVESKSQVPHFYVTTEVDMEAFNDLRARLNAGAAKEQQVRHDAIMLRACGLALTKFADVNGSYRDGQFEYHDYVNIGFAVSVPDGLVVPVVPDCDRKGIREIDQAMRPLIERARANKLTPADMEKSTFSISNLGMYDVEEFGAVVNPPNAAILAIGSTRLIPAAVEGQVVVRPRMKLTLSCDHRILYGARGALFLQELKRLLESPFSLVL